RRRDRASAQGGRAGQESRSGCPRRLGTRRRHPRDGGWTRLQRKPIQSRRPGQAAARLPVQGLCLPRRLPEGGRSADDGRRSTGSDRRLGAGELRRGAPPAKEGAQRPFPPPPPTRGGGAAWGPPTSPPPPPPPP